MPIYKIGNEEFSVPANEAAGFERVYPNAVVRMFDGAGESYDLPLSERANFQTTFSDWSYDAPTKKQNTSTTTSATTFPQVDSRVSSLSAPTALEAPKQSQPALSSASALASASMQAGHLMLDTAPKAPTFEQTKAIEQKEPAAVRLARAEKELEEPQANAKELQDTLYNEIENNPTIGQAANYQIEAARRRIAKAHKPIKEKEKEIERLNGELAIEQFEQSGAKQKIDRIESNAKQTIKDVTDNAFYELAPASDDLYANTLAGTSTADAAAAIWFRNLFNKDIRTAKATIHKAQDTKDTIKEAGHRDGNWLDKQTGGIVRGAWDKGKRLRTWDLGVANSADAITIASVAKKYEENPQEITQQEQEMLDMLGLAAAAQEAYGGFLSRGYQIGQSLPESAGYGFGFALNPAKGLADMAVKKFGTTATRKVAARVIGQLIEAGAVTATSGAFRTAADIAERNTGDALYDFDENGQIVYAGRENNEKLGSAIVEGFTAQLITNFSEQFSENLDVLKVGIRKGLKKFLPDGIGLDDATNIMNSLSNSNIVQGMDKLRKALKIGGAVEEYVEEVVDNVLNASIVGDMSFKSDDPNYVFDLDTNLTTFLSCALMVGSMNAVSYGGAGLHLGKLHSDQSKAHALGRAAFGEEEWKKIADNILTTTPEERKSILMSFVSQQSTTKEQKEALLRYAYATTAVQLFNTRVATNNEEEQAEKEKIRDAYKAIENGYNFTSTPKARRDAKLSLETHLANLKKLGVSDELLETINANPLDALETLKQNEQGYNEEKVQAARNYIYALMNYNAMYQRFQDNEQAEIEYINARVDAATNKQSGTIIRATCGGINGEPNRTVFIADGKVVLYDDSSGINLSESDKSITIIDAETGKKEIVSPEEITGAVTQFNPKQEKETAATEIHKRTEAMIAKDVNGELTEYHEGEEFKLIGKDGKPGSYKVVANAEGQTMNPDGTVNITDGKHNYTVSPDVLQAAKNAKELEQTAEELERRNAEAKAQEQAQAPAKQQAPAPTPQVTINPQDTIAFQGKYGNIISGVVEEVSEDGYVVSHSNDIAVLYPKADVESGLLEVNGQRIEKDADELPSPPPDVTIQMAGDNSPAQAPAPKQQSALERISKDEKGNPQYEQAESGLAWDALVESAGDATTAQTIANEMVSDAQAEVKKAEGAKVKTGTTVEEKIAAHKERQARIDAAKASLQKWQEIASTPVRRTQQAEAQQREQARAEAERRKAEEAKSKATEGQAQVGASNTRPSESLSLLEAIKDLYSKGKEYASKLYQRTYFDVAATPVFMQELGLRGDKFTIKYGVIARHIGKDSAHTLSKKDWEQLPQALQNPFAITRLKDNDDSYRIYTTLKTENGEYVVVGVDVKNAGREIEVNAISTIFGRRSNAHLTQHEEVIYRSKEITPEQLSLLDEPNSHQYPVNRESSASKDSNSERITKAQHEELSEEGKSEAPKEPEKEADNPRGITGVSGEVNLNGLFHYYSGSLSELIKEAKQSAKGLLKKTYPLKG